nr:BA14K family protein [Rhizobium populisoli]
MLSAASLAVAMSLTSLTSAFAVPLPSAPAPQVSAVENVQLYIQRDRNRGDWRDRRDYRDRRDVRRQGWYNGRQGYRDRRPGYRRHSDGFWYPLAAFGAAAIIGGAIASQPRASGGSSHVQWCANRYQSYRASDNTYSPRAGVRAQCNSPY